MLSDDERMQLHILLGQRIFLLRKQRYLTQNQLAEMIGISRSFLSRVEHGTRNTTFDELCEISAAFRLRVSELLSGIELLEKPNEYEGGSCDANPRRTHYL